MKIKLVPVLTITLAAVMLSQAVQAYEPGEFFIRLGGANVSPSESSDGIGIPALGIAPIAGTEAEVNANTQLGITLNYMISRKLGLELLAATPFEHDITANLDGFSSGLRVPAGSTEHLPPTLSLIYYPLAEKNNRFQPYLGLGFNYTLFFKEKANPGLEALTGSLAGAPAPVEMTLKLDDSFGIAAQIGTDIFINDHWHFNAAIRWIDINTDATFTSALGSTITVNDVEIDPLVYQFTVGYRF